MKGGDKDARWGKMRYRGRCEAVEDERQGEGERLDYGWEVGEMRDWDKDVRWERWEVGEIRDWNKDERWKRWKVEIWMRGGIDERLRGWIKDERWERWEIEIRMWGGRDERWERLEVVIKMWGGTDERLRKMRGGRDERWDKDERWGHGYPAKYLWGWGALALLPIHIYTQYHLWHTCTFHMWFISSQLPIFLS